MIKQTVCVVTKERMNKPLSIDLFTKCKFVKLAIFCWTEEEKEFYTARTAGKNVVAIEIQKYQEAGLSGARQHALEYLREENAQFGIIVDDDMSDIKWSDRTIPRTKDPKKYLEIFKIMRKVIVKNNLAILGLAWQGAWAHLQKDRIHVNTKTASGFVMYNLTKTVNVNYDPDMKIFEDVDFFLQCVFNEGYDCGNLSFFETRIKFNSPGGLSQDRIDTQEVMVERMVAKWGLKKVRPHMHKTELLHHLTPNKRSLKCILQHAGRKFGPMRINTENWSILPIG